ANTESLSLRNYYMTYGYSNGKKADITVCQIIENDECEETCFVETKPFFITRASKIDGKNDNRSPSWKSFIRSLTITSKTPKNGIPTVNL
ncbi:1318_t:CDS:2, partial [Funneliformis geosporum]